MYLVSSLISWRSSFLNCFLADYTHIPLPWLTVQYGYICLQLWCVCVCVCVCVHTKLGIIGGMQRRPCSITIQGGCYSTCNQYLLLMSTQEATDTAHASHDLTSVGIRAFHRKKSDTAKWQTHRPTKHVCSSVYNHLCQLSVQACPYCSW